MYVIGSRSTHEISHSVVFRVSPCRLHTSITATHTLSLDLYQHTYVCLPQNPNRSCKTPKSQPSESRSHAPDRTVTITCRVQHSSRRQVLFCYTLRGTNKNTLERRTRFLKIERPPHVCVCAYHWSMCFTYCLPACYCCIMAGTRPIGFGFCTLPLPRPLFFSQVLKISPIPWGAQA